MPIGSTNHNLGQAPWVGPLPLVFAGESPPQVWLGPQPKFPPAHDQVDLVVALGTVLGLPQPPGLRVEREPEGVADAEREDAAARERVVRTARPRRRHPQDLPAEVAAELLGVRAVVAVPTIT